MKDNSEGDEWSVDEQMLQEMKDSYLQVRRKDRKSAGGHVTISDSELPVSAILLLLVCVSLTIIGQPRNSVLILRM